MRVKRIDLSIYQAQHEDAPSLARIAKRAALKTNLLVEAQQKKGESKMKNVILINEPVSYETSELSEVLQPSAQEDIREEEYDADFDFDR